MESTLFWVITSSVGHFTIVDVVFSTAIAFDHAHEYQQQ